MKESKLLRRVKLWHERLRLQAYDIQVDVVENLRVGRKPCHAVTKFKTKTVTVDQRIEMRFDAGSLAQKGTDNIDHIIVHELVHVIESGQENVFEKYLGATKGIVYDAWSDENEKACDHVAQIIINAYKKVRPARVE